MNVLVEVFSRCETNVLRNVQKRLVHDVLHGDEDIVYKGKIADLITEELNKRIS